MLLDQERFWRVLIVLAIVLAGFALGFALVKQQPAVVQGGFSLQTVTMVEYRVTDGSSRISYGGDSYTVTDGLVSLPYTATWAADMVAAGILERVGAPSSNLYYGGSTLRVATSGTLDVQSGAVVSIGAPILTPLTASSTLTVAGATALDGGVAVDTNKFTVDTSGNTAIAGALSVAGNVSSSAGGVTVTDDLVVTSTLVLSDVTFSGPVRFGSASGVMTGTTIAHGLGTTPTVAMLTPSYSGTFTNSVYVSSTNATSITVGFGYSEGVTTTDVYWLAGK